MQPTSDQPDRSQPYSSQSDQPDEPAPGAAGWAGPVYAPALPAATVKRARPWRVAIVATLTLLLLILGLGNQWVTDAINRHIVGNSFFDNSVRAITTYQWRFSPRGKSDFAHVWLSEFGLIATALVLTLLLTAVVARGYGGFGQAFIGAWMAVVVATLLGGYVRASIIDGSKLLGPGSSNRANVIFFSALSPNAFLLAAALGFGFVVAIVAGVTAALSRQTDVVSAPVPAGYGAPAFGAPGVAQPAFGQAADQPADQAYWTPPPAAAPGPIATPSPWGETSTTDAPPAAGESRETPVDEPQHTAVLPQVDDEHTTQLPRTSSSDEPGEGPRHLDG